MTQLQAINKKFKQLLEATKELRNLADKDGYCPHCVIHDICECPDNIKESLTNLYNIAEDKRKELISMLERLDPSLAI